MSKTLQQYQPVPCPHAGSGVHGWVLSTATRAARAGVSQAEAERDILQAMTRPPDPPSEVARDIAKAYRETAATAGQEHHPATFTRAAKPKPLPMTREAFIRRGAERGGTEADWFHRSLVYLPEAEPGREDALAVLRTLWLADEFLFMGDRYGREVQPVHELIRRLEQGEAVPPHLIVNPLCGHPVPNSKDGGKLSARCDEAVAVFRYAVAEFDDMSREAQLQFWAGFTAAPVAALVDSGGKSIHAWLRVDAPNREAWERDIEGGLFGRVLIPLGCDAACRNESRLSRMPGHYRADKTAWQRLLYLNPETGR